MIFRLRRAQTSVAIWLTRLASVPGSRSDVCDESCVSWWLEEGADEPWPVRSFWTTDFDCAGGRAGTDVAIGMSGSLRTRLAEEDDILGVEGPEAIEAISIAGA